MKKRILTFLTLLVAFFGLIGLTTNNYAVINAAGNDASVEYDANVAISNVPDSAILSFPLTYESVYGNEITWSVNDNEFIKYDSEAQWMVVYRSLEQDGSATLTVTVKNGTTTVTKTKEVSVPKGYTSAPMYSITYELDGGTLEGQKTEYKLGDPSYELPTPTKQGHVFLGWYDENDDKVETILVGSMKNYNLTAEWEARAVKEIEITKAPNKVDYKGGETIDLTGIEVTAHYNDGTTEAGVTVTKTKEYVNYGENKVEVTYKVGEQEFKASYAITVDKNKFEVTFNGDTVTYDGKSHSISVSEATLPKAIKVTYEGNEQVNANEEGYTITAKFSWDESDQNYEFYSTNYELPNNLTAKLIIKKADYDLTDVLFEDVTVTYDGEEHKVEVTGLPEGLSVSYDVSNTLTNVGSVTVTATLSNSNPNYNDIQLTDNKATLTIEKQPITLTTQEKTISLSEINNILWTYTGIVDGISVTPEYYLGGQKVEAANLVAGQEYTVKFMVESSNYDVTLADTKLTVSEEQVTFKVIGTYTYFGSAQTLVVKAYDKDDNEIEGTIKYDGQESYQETDAGTYKVTVSLEGTQYGNVSGEVDFVITAKKATLKVSATTSVYGDTPSLKYTQEGVLPDDLAGLAINLTTEGVNVGEHAVTVSYTENSNYDITVDETAKHTITPKAATLTVTNTSSVYGQNPVFAYTPEGILGNDIDGLSINFESLANETADAGSYEVSLTYTANANYNITVEKGTHTITRKELTNNDVTISVLGSDYNAQNEATLTPAVTVKYNGTSLSHEELVYSYAEDKVGTATITIKLNGNYQGTLNTTFEVTEYGKAGEVAEELDAYYADKLTGTLYNVPALQVEFDDENVSVNWVSQSTALSINEWGVVTVEHPENKDAKVVLIANIKYGTTSSAILTYEFIISSKISIDLSNTEYTFTSTELETEGNYQLAADEVLIAEYEIEILDAEGNEVNNIQNGVTVRMLIPEEYRGLENLTVYHIADNGEKEEIENVTKDGNYLVFTAYSFSPYIIAYELPENPKTESDIYAMLEAGKTEITFNSNVEVDTLLIDGKTVTLNLGDYKLLAEDKDLDGSAYGIYAINGAVVTINASENGGINAGSGADWNIPLRASQNSTINVYGGNYYTGPNSGDSGNSGMFVSDTSTINIYGGTFETEKDYLGFYYLFNIKMDDKETAKINVFEGTFINANPESSNVQTNLVQKGSSVTMTEENGKKVYTVTREKYTITFTNEDGTVLQSTEVAYGETPTYNGETPTKESDAEFTYTFAGWDKGIASATEDAAYTATYTKTYIEYTVKYLDHDGTELLNETYYYGKEPAAPANPTREADETYTYVFKEWTKEVEGTVTTYTAQYEMNLIVTEPQEEVIVARFNFGENGANGHKENSTSVSTYEEESNGYTLSITDGAKMYINCNDEMGKSAIKLGTGSAAGSFTVVVPENVTKVVIYVAGYKDDEAKISINEGNPQTISKFSDNGEYTAIEVDTSTNKTISFTTLSGGWRCMINKIEYRGVLKDGETALEEEKEKYLVEFDSGSTENTINWYEQDQMVEEPEEEPQKDGYEFLGWYVGDEEVTFPYLVTKNVTFTAKWKHVHNKCETCGKCTFTDCDGSEEEKCDCNASSEAGVLATFNLGDNGSATHADGSSATSYTETVNGYTLNITNGTNMYTGAIDAKGNSCIKFGASSKAGSMTFTVPDDVTKVVIYVAQYKANTTKITVNGTSHTITTASNNGEYTAIEIDTSTNKTISFVTVSGGYRCMVNSIQYCETK